MSLDLFGKLGTKCFQFLVGLLLQRGEDDPGNGENLSFCQLRGHLSPVTVYIKQRAGMPQHNP